MRNGQVAAHVFRRDGGLFNCFNCFTGILLKVSEHRLVITWKVDCEVQYLLYDN